jgi:hypothetical protein
VYFRASGRERFLRGPFAALLTRMAALSCFLVAIVPLDYPSGSSQLNIFGALREPSRANLGGAWN